MAGVSGSGSGHLVWSTVLLGAVGLMLATVGLAVGGMLHLPLLAALLYLIARRSRRSAAPSGQPDQQTQPQRARGEGQRTHPHPFAPVP